MKRLLFTFVLTFFVALVGSAQLLFRISGKDLQKPSYIVGTYHLADASFANQIVGVRDALDEVEQVCGELKMSVMQIPDSIATLRQAMQLPQGKTLKDVLSAEQFEAVSAYVKGLLGAGFENEMVLGQMGILTPAALQTQLEVLCHLKKTQGQFDAQNLIDSYLQNVAIEAGKKDMGLESMSSQINIIFKVPMERQIESLMCVVNNKEYYDQLADQMILKYSQQDVEVLHELLDSKMNSSCDSTPEEMDALLYNRNRNWIKQMPGIMSVPTLFVVGAGHLGGEKGVLSLLKKAGYQVEGVK